MSWCFVLGSVDRDLGLVEPDEAVAPRSNAVAAEWVLANDVGESEFDGLPDDVDNARLNCEHDGDLGWVASDLDRTLNENRAIPPTRRWSTTTAYRRPL